MADTHATTHIPNTLEPLTDHDLLVVLLAAAPNAPERAARLLAHYGSLHTLAQTPAAALETVAGLSTEMLRPLTAAFQLHQRLEAEAKTAHPAINSAEDAARLLGDMRSLLQEQVRLILLDLNRRVLATPTVYIGTLHGTVIRTAEIFREPLLRNCPAFVLAHNHPSGDPAPSPEDLELTRTLIAAGKLLDIQLLDHLILAESGWCSLKQQGLAF
ncbi:MAG TPA: DNA repair protein RadC [Phototrophicaceae bacterium]|nr:DNA repair protein RadC [Phototrophicaceae bacterium]